MTIIWNSFHTPMFRAPMSMHIEETSKLASTNSSMISFNVEGFVEGSNVEITVCGHLQHRIEQDWENKAGARFRTGLKGRKKKSRVCVCVQIERLMKNFSVVKIKINICFEKIYV